MTAPSPAPWTAHGFAIYSGETLVAQVPVAEFSDDRYVREHALPEAEAKLNLRLIRMAPEMRRFTEAVLDTCEWAIGNGKTLYACQDLRDAARELLAAIAAKED